MTLAEINTLIFVLCPLRVIQAMDRKLQADEMVSEVKWTDLIYFLSHSRPHNLI